MGGRSGRDLRSRARRGVVGLLGAIALLAVAPAASHATVNFNVKGKWVCNNRGTVSPIAGARVELWHSIDYWFDDKLGSTHAATDGSFNFGVQADSNFDLYAKVVLNDDNGVSLGNWYSFSDWDIETSTAGSHSGIVNLGTWQLSKDNGSGTPRCAIWQGAHNAYADYRKVVGSPPPDSHYSISADFPCCGTPFTTTDTTRWPGGYQTGQGSNDPAKAPYSVNFHEFAHSVRHSFDGGTAHFLFDAARFAYPQTHSLCSNTNNGFAFNEGWAENWAGTLTTCAGDPTNFNYEGNVATALNGLEQCVGRKTLVQVLQQNPAGVVGGIHSYSEFRAKLASIRNLNFCNIRVITGGLEGAELPLSSSQQTSAINGQINAQTKLIANLSRRLTSSRRGARSPGRCILARTCVPALRKLVDPSVLTAQLQQAKLVLARLQAGLTDARKSNFLPSALQPKYLTDDNALNASRKSFEQASQAILINGLKSSVATIKAQSGFGPAQSTAEFRRINQRLSLLTRTRKRHAATPNAIDTLLSAPTAPTDGAKRLR
jgi:hypothetical protein